MDFRENGIRTGDGEPRASVRKAHGGPKHGSVATRIGEIKNGTIPRTALPHSSSLLFHFADKLVFESVRPVPVFRLKLEFV